MLKQRIDQNLQATPEIIIRELKQQWRQRLQKCHSKSEFTLPQNLSRLIHLV